MRGALFVVLFDVLFISCLLSTLKVKQPADQLGGGGRGNPTLSEL